MARKRKPEPPKWEGVNPFVVGDEIVVKRRVLWTGYSGIVDYIESGACRCLLEGPNGKFHAVIPANELQLDL